MQDRLALAEVLVVVEEAPALCAGGGDGGSAVALVEVIARGIDGEAAGAVEDLLVQVLYAVALVD
jgi:hypothetical protein